MWNKWPGEGRRAPHPQEQGWLGRHPLPRTRLFAESHRNHPWYQKPGGHFQTKKGRYETHLHTCPSRCFRTDEDLNPEQCCPLSTRNDSHSHQPQKPLVLKGSSCKQKGVSQAVLRGQMIRWALRNVWEMGKDTAIAWGRGWKSGGSTPGI